MTELKFTSADDIRNYFITLKNNEDENNWQKGDALVAAVNQGYKLKPLYHGVLASVLQCSYSTVNNQWRTAKIFPEDKRAAEKCWSVHQQAARAVKRITRVEDYALAWECLDRAIKEPLTVDGLADAMKANGNDVHKGKPVYLCKRVRAQLRNLDTFVESGMCEVVLYVDKSLVKRVGLPADILLTMFIPAQVDNLNLEMEAAA